MMNIDDLVNKYGNKLDNGELEVDATELYGGLLDASDKTSDDEFKYKDTIEMLLNMIENGYNPHSFYDTDIIANVKRLVREKQ